MILFPVIFARPLASPSAWRCAIEWIEPQHHPSYAEARRLCLSLSAPLVLLEYRRHHLSPSRARRRRRSSTWADWTGAVDGHLLYQIHTLFPATELKI